MSVPKDLLERFKKLFKGFEHAFGQFEIKSVAANGKNKGSTWTAKEDIPEEAWVRHLEGHPIGLGIGPLQKNNTCRFGAIDVDDYKVDHAKLEQKIRKLGLPLVVCRTKSGGAHLYCFMCEDVDASVVQAALKDWCLRLGFGDRTEIFPKQTSRIDPDEIGNWINLPYYNAARTMRFAIKDGKALNLEEFLHYAEEMQVLQEDIENLEVQDINDEDEDFYEAPPCLQHFANMGGFDVGGMKNGMFNVGVYLRKRYGDEEWKDKFNEYATKMCDPPLKISEINGLMKQLSKKTYSYTCNQIPICNHCQKKPCRKRKFGIGGGEKTAANVTVDIRVTTQYLSEGAALWAVEVNGREIILDTDTLFNVGAFNKKVAETLKIVPLRKIQSAAWLELLNELIQNAETIQESSEASEKGQVVEHVRNFAAMDSPASTLGEIQSGRPFVEDSIAHFKLSDLIAHVKRHGGVSVQPHIMARYLRELGGEPQKKWLGHKSENIWMLPIPPTETNEAGEEVEAPIAMNKSPEDAIPEDGF